MDDDDPLPKVSALVAVRLVAREVNRVVDTVTTEPLVTVVSRVDGRPALLEPEPEDEEDAAGELDDDEPMMKVDTRVVVRSVICVVERFVAVVMTRLVVIVVGRCTLTMLLLGLSRGGEELWPDVDGTAELGTVEKAPDDDEDPECGNIEDGMPEGGNPENEISEDGTLWEL